MHCLEITITLSNPFDLQAGPYIVDCGGKNANFVWIEFPGKDRLINVATVEVEKAHGLNMFECRGLNCEMP